MSAEHIIPGMLPEPEKEALRPEVEQAIQKH